MKKYLIYVMLAVVAQFVACDNTPKFTISGTIDDADSLTLYLEDITNTRSVLLDSVILDATGKYSFTQQVPEQAGFYRLSLGEQYVYLVVDTVANIKCNGTSRHLSTDYTIAGNDDCAVVREVTLDGGKLKSIVNNALSMSGRESQQVALDSIAAYKERMTALILQEPSSPVAYYILMQRINGLPIFDTFDPHDNRIIAAVATAHEVYASEAPRTAILRDIALQGMAARRSEKQSAIEIDADKVTHVDYVDIALYDVKGKEQKLSSVATEKKVVLLDFTAYALEYSPAYNMQLMEIYEMYRSRGLEIYQVSFDSDYNRWQTVADNLPWISVNDADNVYSTLVTLYDVQSLPTCYVIVNNGEQILRPVDVDDLKQKLTQIMG